MLFHSTYVNITSLYIKELFELSLFMIETHKILMQHLYFLLTFDWNFICVLVCGNGKIDSVLDYEASCLFVVVVIKISVTISFSCNIIFLR